MLSGKKVYIDGHELELYSSGIDIFKPNSYEIRTVKIGNAEYEVCCAIGALNYDAGEIFICDEPYVFSQKGKISILDSEDAEKNFTKQLISLRKRLLWLTVSIAISTYAGEGYKIVTAGNALLGMWCLSSAIQLSNTIGNILNLP